MMEMKTDPKIDQLCINTVRFPSIDMVDKAKSGHPGTQMSELIPLFATKVENIETRLDQAKEMLALLSEELGARRRKEEPVAPPWAMTATSGASDEEESEEEEEDEEELRRTSTLPRVEDFDKVVERRARELSDEVMHVLTKLEQIDTRRENEGT